jgi:hypothetical protein
MLFTKSVIPVIISLLLFYCQKEETKDDTTKGIALAGLVKANASTIAAQEAANSVVACKNCHSETTEIGNKIQWARAGWDESVHKNGYRKEMYGLISAVVPPTSASWAVIGYEWEGSNANYSNGGGCQVCHTKEGFRKKVAGTYGTGLSGADLNLKTIHSLPDVSKDLITYPSNIGCFACHSPHEKGNFDLLVPNGTKVTTEAGSEYTKSKGSVCASCHIARMGGKSTVAEIIQGYASVAVTSNLSTRMGPHYGPQTDMLLGKGGAEVPGKTYTNSIHTVIDGANCQSCHQVDDFNNSGQTSGDSLSPAVGGHSFAVTGIVHSSPKGIAKGCKTSGCHASAAAGTLSSDDGHKLKGDAFIGKDGTSGTKYYVALNAALVALANPAATTPCDGLLMEAAVAKGGTLKFTTYPGGTVNSKRCKLSSDSGAITVKGGGTGVVVGGTDDASKVARAVYNYRFVIEDRSFGIHNYKYATQLLVDSCEELKSIATSSLITCPTRP